MNSRLWTGLALTATLVGTGMTLAANDAPKPAAPASPEALELFEKEIRPLLVTECESCHGPKLQQGGLRFADRAALLKGGEKGPSVVPGHPEKSLLIQAVRHQGALKMPPGKKLTVRQIESLEQWVKLGAPWPEAQKASGIVLGDQTRIFKEAKTHWAYQPVRRPAVPTVKNKAWVKTPVDAFVLAKLEKAGLKPSPQADRRTVLRRLYYDLIGLPPSAEELEAFQADSSPDAYEKVVDRLLASPRYGERWGRHWLDVARFADTKDGVLMYGDSRIRPYAYTYRDYVIRAFNEDTPYDQFLREQLAADQITPKVAPWRLAAMGFLTLGRQFDSNVHDVIDDQIDTVGRGMLGLTIACARCHDHKYDAIPTADYYALYGVFAGSEAPVDLPLIDKPENTPGYAEYEKKFTPQRKKLEDLVTTQYDLLIETGRQRAGDYLVHIATKPPDPLENIFYFYSLEPQELRPTMVAKWRKLVERRGTADDPVFGPWKDLMELPPAEMTSRAPEVMNRWKSVRPGINAGELNPLVRDALVNAKLTDRASVAQAYGDLLKRIYEESKGMALIAAPEKRQLLDLVVGKDAPGYFHRTQIWNFLNRKEKDEYGGITNGLDILAVQNAGAPPRAMVLNDTLAPYEPRVFLRGSPSAQGEPTPRQFLKILSGPNRQPFPRGSGRLDLANAIADPKNPLTARVLVNRVWMHHFGEPLVSSPSDFGSRSTAPSHPLVLDWLASQFVSPQMGWSMKKLHKLIVMSSVYRQSSSLVNQQSAISNHQSAMARDPENRLLWRFHRRRLDFEQMRDTMLALSARLDLTMLGRPVREGLAPEATRRTVYALVDRQSLPDTFRAFNFAQPDQSIERRPNTTVPQQALFGLNSPFVIEQAKAIAARVEVKDAASDEVRVAALYRLILSRKPSEDEVAAALGFVRASRVSGENGSKLSAWEQYAQVLLQTNEVMFLD